MTGDQVTRRVYSAEELHRLRVSCSQPKLSEAIEENEREEAELIKEHVLRGTKSFTARSFRSRTSGNSLRVPSNKENRSTADAENSNSSSGHDVPLNGPVLGEISANGQIARPGVWKIRPSPTPSLKKKKAEAIVKAHGSPQHVRVTAGGRIVPSEQSPLCHPRYGYSAIKANGGLIKFAPRNAVGGQPQWTQATQDGFVAQDVNGRLCQIVNGTILPLNEVDGALRLYIHAPNLNITAGGPSFGPNGSYNGQQRTSSLSKPSSPPDPSLPTQTHALELEYSKFEHELKELNKTEVLHGRTMGKVAKEALVAKRRELVVKLDSIRKAIKSIKSMSASDAAPTSAHPTSNHPPASQGQPSMPHFLPPRMPQDRDLVFSSVPQPHAPFFGVPQPPQYGSELGFAPPESAYAHPPFVAHRAPLFVPPPSYDGSVAAPFVPYGDTSTGISNGYAPPQAAGPLVAPNHAGRLPQTDGAGSINDVQKAKSPSRLHAVDIKPPDSKQAPAVKSNLNPMSPAYKPGGGVLQNTRNGERILNNSGNHQGGSALSPAHQLKPLAADPNAINGSEETISPTKKSPRLNSSSVSSFETADFFPRNTREYSTRKYAYPDPSSSEDKENVVPNQTTNVSNHTVSALKSIGSKECAPPAPPSSTSATHTGKGNGQAPADVKKDSSSSRGHAHPSDHSSVPDRQANNLSPKHRRSEHVFAQEFSVLPKLPSSSPQKYESCVKEQPHITYNSMDSIDYSDASINWIEGFRAGLARQPIEAHRIGDFLQGYCEGLLKSMPAQAGQSTGSPIKSSTSRRPSPAVIQTHSAAREPCDSKCEPFESKMHSMDTLKEAVFAPANEDAILSPSIDGPHINETPLNLGGWARDHDMIAKAEALVASSGDGLGGFPFPHRPASMEKRYTVLSEDNALTALPSMDFASQGPSTPHAVHRSELAAQTTPHSSGPSANRVVSMTGVDSNLYRQWPGARVFSNQLEWKSASSVAQAAGFASGHFAHVRSDPTISRPRAELPGSSDVADVAAMFGNLTMNTHSRFKEGSLDGITNPPNSPQPQSPPMSPSLSLGKEGKKSSSNSPIKGISPTKIKFETMAEKVGIKVSGGNKKDKQSGDSPTGATGKRGWRDVWRGSR